MKYIFDLDETLIQSTTLNNDAYNYALEKFGYPRINTSERITREELNFIPEELLRKIIKEKQKYFTSEWLPYRIIINKELVKKLKEYERENCYLWTKANKDRVKSILSCCKLERLFNKIIFDNKTAFQTSISKLNVATHSDVFIIYENNKKFFDNGCESEYNGVEYKSTLNSDGVNLAIFDTTLFCCKSVQDYEVKELIYKVNPEF